MTRDTQSKQRRVAGVALSLAAHGAVLIFVLAMGALHLAKVNESAPTLTVAQIEVAGGAHAVEIPLPRMKAAAETRKPMRNEEAKLRMLPAKPKQDKVKAGGGEPPLPHAGEGSGNAEGGNGSDDRDAVPAFPVFSPKPPVTDRGLLPATEEKIVVDVKVDESGAVVSEALVKGMGNALDQIVLNTVMTWRFEPAKVNGKPVATEAELIFPFDLKYPVG
jgi:TonB family protein